jgi:hypothetical protein
MKTFSQFCQELSEGWGAETQKKLAQQSKNKWDALFSKYEDHKEATDELKKHYANNKTAEAAERRVVQKFGVSESRSGKLLARAIKNLETRKKIASGEVKTGAAQPKPEEQKKPELKSEQVEQLQEWNAQGHKHSDGDKWMTSNGYENIGGKKHSKWRHAQSGHIVTGWGYHGKEIEASVARKARKAVMDHHTEKNLPYTELS